MLGLVHSNSTLLPRSSGWLGLAVVAMSLCFITTPLAECIPVMRPEVTSGSAGVFTCALHHKVCVTTELAVASANFRQNGIVRASMRLSTIGSADARCGPQAARQMCGFV